MTVPTGRPVCAWRDWTANKVRPVPCRKPAGRAVLVPAGGDMWPVFVSAPLCADHRRDLLG